MVEHEAIQTFCLHVEYEIIIGICASIPIYSIRVQLAVWLQQLVIVALGGFVVCAF